jgi:hypothetical protein
MAPPAPSRPPAPPAPPGTDTAPYAGVAVRRARPPRPAASEAPPPPGKQGRGALFWTGIGCGGCLLLVLLGVGGFAAFLYFSARGPRDVVTQHLQNVRAGKLDAAYDALAPSYQQQVSREAFAAFVARHKGVQRFSDFSYREYKSDGTHASLGGFVNSDGGDRETATYSLVQEGGHWKITGIDVGAEHPEAQQVSGPSGLRIDSLAAQKSASGDTIEVRLSMNVAGFEVRPQGGQYGIDLAMDAETVGPDGLRVDALSREDVQRFQRTTSMETGAVAPITIPLIVDSSLPPGNYTVRLRVRDRVGGGTASAETQIALP